MILMHRVDGVGEEHKPRCLAAIDEPSSCEKPRVQVFLAQNGGRPAGGGEFCEFEWSDEHESERGKTELITIMSFVDDIEAQISKCLRLGMHQLVVVLGGGGKALHHGVFLTGCFMILKQARTPFQVSQIFGALGVNVGDEVGVTVEALTIVDCWRGVKLAMERGWINAPDTSNPDNWGMYEKQSMTHFASCWNGEVHEVIPGTNGLVVFREPSDLGGGLLLFRDNEEWNRREFSPEFYVPILKAFDAVAVLSLATRRYDSSVFTAAGLDFQELSFDNCNTPPPRVISRFVEIVDSANGAVALHWSAADSGGGGKTLVALYMMRSHGFGAREALAWVCMALPGPRTGEDDLPQLTYLCNVETMVKARLAENSKRAKEPRDFEGLSICPPIAIGEPSADSEDKPIVGHHWLPEGKQASRILRKAVTFSQSTRLAQRSGTLRDLGSATTNAVSYCDSLTLASHMYGIV